MSRLLFAAARGARIQYNQYTEHTPVWANTSKWSSICANRLRIHPDDAHLQYGPLSTALRKLAETGLTDDLLVTATMTEYLYEACSFVRVKPDKLANLALLLAEQVADEGM